VLEYFDKLSEPLPEEDLAKLVDDFARAIVRRGLEAPAIMFLEMNKPLSYIAGQGVIVATPLIAPLVGADRMGRFSRFLQSPDNIERLIQRIEELVEEKKERANNNDESGSAESQT